MKTLIGPKKIVTSVFISGTGSNLNNLINFSKKKNSPISIILVVSNNKNAKGLGFSKKNKIESKVYQYTNKMISENKILKDLNKKKVQLICLAGFMKILSKNFIKKFNGKILNIHPSLLPKYKGLNTHKRVIENNEKFSGCTVHLVSSKLDSGKIILQKKIRINKKDNYKTLGEKILRQEHLLYPRAIKKFISSY
tara:strand:+ start:2264 stop:2848 length:585 start_codon:yes stop_codon:yes gene_type:complete